MAANDRLGDLLGGSGGQQEAASSTDIELGEAGKSKQSKSKDGIQAFFREVEGIKNDIAKIEAATKSIRSLTEKYRKAKSSKEEAQFSQDLNDIVDRTSALAKKVKTD